MGKVTVSCLFGSFALMIFLPVGPAFAQTLPVHEGTRLLRSGDLVVEVGDPESGACRWNRGVRFSPVANVLRLQLLGREFLYSPVAGGAVDGGYTGGLPMEFDIGQEEFQPDPPGYNEGASGDPFLKIGVGILTRNSSAYNFSTSYPIIELAETTATWAVDRVHFVQTLAGTANGYACRLEEELVVKNDRLIMRYVLENTGTEAFTTEQYLHNFLCFSGSSVGPDYRVYFPYAFTASPDVPLWSPPTSRVRAVAANPDVVRLANVIAYLEKISSVPKIWIYKPEDYAARDVFAVEQTGTGQRLVIDTTAATPYVGIWTTDYQVSPEQFVQITLAPGEATAFTRTYLVGAGGALAADSTGDGLVNAADLSTLSAAWLSTPGTVGWEPACDIAEPMDDRIDLDDLAAVAAQWRRDTHEPVPVAHWQLDETTGRLASDCVSHRHGILKGFADEGSPWTEARVGGGLMFDGIDDRVDIEGYSGPGGRQPRTVMAWIKTSERSGGAMTILAWGTPDPGRYFALGIDPSGRLNVTCPGGSTVAGGGLVGDARWHHVAAVLDPMQSNVSRVSDIRLYVDGQRQGLYDLIDHDINTGCEEDVRIGAGHGPAVPFGFGGIVDDVRVYDRALSTENIIQVYGDIGI